MIDQDELSFVAQVVGTQALLNHDSVLLSTVQKWTNAGIATRYKLAVIDIFGNLNIVHFDNNVFLFTISGSKSV